MGEREIKAVIGLGALVVTEFYALLYRAGILEVE